MPELPEVERARKLIEDSCKGYKIDSVTTVEDKLVYTGGITHEDFANELRGRTVTGCKRKGKTFWITLSGDGKLPVLHFGMTGMIQLKGQEPTWYRRRPKETTDEWPPKFHKFVLNLVPQSGSVGDEPRQLAFMDSRRFGRIRLVPSPVEDHPPVKALGFDPVLSYPLLEEFKTLLKKKKGTVKGVIMDQSFSAGVGNWVADEILYQARIHPACPVPDLTDEQVEKLHRQIKAVPTKAVEVNADSMQFPEDWLFRWRWSKGKKQPGGKKVKDEAGEDAEMLEELKPKDKDFLALPDGKPATIEFIEVAGRTSAVVVELQKMPEGVEIKPKVTKGAKGGKGAKGKGKKAKKDDDEDEESDLTEESEEDVKPVPRKSTKGQAKKARKSAKEEDEDEESDLSEDSEEVKPVNTTPRQKAAAAKRAKVEDAESPDVRPASKRKSTGKVKDEPEDTPQKKPRKSGASESNASGTKGRKSEK